ncbi:hypothetical protein CTAYLR_002926 [Chrysophaeum taylorii]|uniref:Uncharacterized protein n=1 Tax=Chrysophaeum taylorii TaxID=2483200 RepID=A0AAD7UMP9_9STRA|nr:hypothetical protein CTAYLR_002926 [Chrysophaeum taylorii]
MAGRKQAIYNGARSLADNEHYIIQIFDVAPCGVLVKAYRQSNSIEIYMPITEGELDKATLNRSEKSLSKLADSLDLVEKGGQTFLESSIPGISKPKVVPSGDGVRQFIGRTKAGDETLPEFLTKALAELCKEKPSGIEAVRWLGNWLLENNPNQPRVEEPSDEQVVEEPVDDNDFGGYGTLLPNMFQVVFVLGGPGAGKGTQCAKISEAFSYVHLSAGDLLRAARQDPNSTHGELINSFIKEGKIVPVDITIGLLKAAMEQSGKRHFLVDGFPRNLDNLDGWNKHMSDCAHVNFLLFLATTEEVMQDRILARGALAAKAGAIVRADDNVETIKKRFHTYLESTMPIINHFKSLGLCREVDSSPPPDDVFAEVAKHFV